MPVEPSSPRYARQGVLDGFGLGGQQKLAAAHVVVIGAGGLGSAILPALAAAGVGTISIVDDDTVDASNLHRQTIHGVDDVGSRKVMSAAASIAALSPETTVDTHDLRFGPSTSFDLLVEADLVIDASDNLATRYHANDAAAARGIPLVWGSALGFSGQVGVAWDGAGIDYRDLFPEQTGDVDGDTCEIVGVLPTVCGVIGSLMATEALKLLTGIGDPLLGRVLVFDALTGGMREISYTRDPDAPRPGSIEGRTTIPEPDPTRSVTPADLARLLVGTAPLLLDVRERSEASVVSLPDAVLIPLAELPDRLDELADNPAGRNADIVVYCHHGVRSARALALLQDAGFTHARHLSGGIDAYAQTADTSLPRY